MRDRAFRCISRIATLGVKMGAETCSEVGEWGEWGEGGAVCRRGLRRGSVSRPFRAADLLRALAAPARTVYVEVDSAGYLCAAGAGGAAGGAAALCVRAALARSVPAHSLQLRRAPRPAAHTPTDDADPLLQLRLVGEAAPHAALRVWLDERLRAALGVPHLALHNIRGEMEYACHVCGACFLDPNPLKAHLFLRCAAPARGAFWRAVAARLQPPPPAARLEAWGARGGGAHACLYCGKLYSRRYGLKIHIRTHTGYRPLRCRHCARAFGDPSNLNKHVRLHAARASPRAPSPAPRAPLTPRASSPASRVTRTLEVLGLPRIG